MVHFPPLPWALGVGMGVAKTSFCHMMQKFLFYSWF